MERALREAVVCWGLISGKSVGQIAVATGWEVGEVEGMVAVPEVREAVEACERGVVERMSTAEYAIGTVAKASAGEMLAIVARTARKGKSDAMRYKAAEYILGLAGHVPVKKVENLQVDRMLGQMSEEELEAFVATGAWPERLSGRRVLAS